VVLHVVESRTPACCSLTGVSRPWRRWPRWERVTTGTRTLPRAPSTTPTLACPPTTMREWTVRQAFMVNEL